MNSEFTTKEPPLREPNLDGWFALNAARNRMAHAPMIARKAAHEAEPTSREIVRRFLSLLAPAQSTETPALSKDLERLSRVIRSVIQAADEEILTSEEADAVIRFMAECFASRRIDEIFTRVTKPNAGSWFILHGHVKGER